MYTANAVDRTARPANPTVTVVIPTRNEADNLRHLLPLLPNVNEVLVIDGNSTDDTLAVARNLIPASKLTVLHQSGRGKGNAIAEGLLGAKSDIVVMIDADCSMDPAEIHSLVGTLRGGADVVKGSRYTTGGGSVDLSGIRSLGNKALTLAASLLYRTRWDELCYGYAAFWADILPALRLDELGTSANHVGRLQYGSGFEIEAILFCRSVRAGLRVAEVPSFEYERIHGESNLSTWADGWRVLTAVWRERTFAQARDRQVVPGWKATATLPAAAAAATAVISRFPQQSDRVDAELREMATLTVS